MFLQYDEIEATVLNAKGVIIGQGHHHQHHHDHSVPNNFNMAFVVGIILNTGFVVIEAFYGFVSQSLALLADAGHNLSDVGGLILAWGASYLATRPPSKRFTYGFRRSSIMAALLNATILLVAVGAIALESIHRLREPTAVSETTVIWVAAVGIVINTITALLFARGRNHDINIKGAYLHMAADAAISAGVVLAGFAIKFTGWLWLDSVVSLAIAVLIAYSSWELLRESFQMAMDAVPESINPEEVKQFLLNQNGVQNIHDLHIWSMSTTETALTVHLIREISGDEDEFLHKIAHELEENFNINHSTVQIEKGRGHSCHLEPDDVV